MSLTLRPAAECRFDLVSLGEVMLRLDPGDTRVHTTRSFQAWEGGGEYNVARGLKRCFGLRTALVTRLRRQPGRPAGRGPDLPGRRRPELRALGRRTTASAAPCATASTSPSAASACARRWAARTAATRRCRSSSRATSTGTGSSARRARAGSTPAASSRRSPRRRRWSRRRPWQAAKQARDARVLRPQLPRLAVEVDRRQAARAAR